MTAVILISTVLSKSQQVSASTDAIVLVAGAHHTYFAMAPRHFDLPWGAVLTSNRGLHRYTDEAIFCFGANDRGQLGVSPSNNYRVSPNLEYIHGPGSCEPLSGVLEIKAGAAHTCALTSTGEVYCWGFNLYGQTGVVADQHSIVREPQKIRSGLPYVTRLSAGYYHTSAATKNNVYCWGQNRLGQLGVAPSEEPLHPRKHR